ncbi:unnamed protein product [Kuraishia capsulata CBS 1993]|uniref:Peptidase S54 rhomboid domain-containing protein n=1 Tax=Kuraishia capsulata CBS 1993 TaxID=1382522 RepID=W6MMQ6_9ASCO|nr:uncharacterized protein KUCA_T00003869001 [Kuraishia capsulata CBS 1993]CDK27889.1 unnamed protein product [Kuraishia capsulata CBS 1993]
MTSVLPKGFTMMPVTRYLTGFVICAPLLVSLLGIKHLLVLSYDPFISSWHQYWRFAVFQTAFQNESEVVVAITLLHFALKHLERLYGSFRLASLLIWSSLYNVVLVSILSFLVYRVLGVNLFVSAGPYGIFFTLLYLYWQSTPSIYRFELVFSGVPGSPNPAKLVITDGIFVKILMVQLFVSDGVLNSGIPSAIGVAVGALIHSHILPGKSVDFPLVIPFLRRYAARKPQPTRPTVSDVQDESDDERDATAFRDDEQDTPIRPLGTQLLDTFRT